MNLFIYEDLARAENRAEHLLTLEQSWTRV